MITASPPSVNEWFNSAVSASEVSRRSVQGIVVTLFRRIGVRIIQFCSLLFLARLLTPGDFGLIAIVAAVVGFGALLADMAISEATVRVTKLTHLQASNLFWIKIAAAVLVVAVLFALLPLLRGFYDDSRVQLVMAALTAGVLIKAVGSTHGALLQRRLHFPALARVEIYSVTVTAAVSLWFALHGSGYWSLVFGLLAGNVVTLVLYWTFCSWRPSLPVFDTEVRSIVRLALRLSGYNVMAYVAGQISTILIGRNSGSEPAGHFNRATNLQSLMLGVILEPLGTVAGPAMSRLATQPEKLCNYYYKLSTLLVIAGLPVAFVGLVLPQELVIVLFGEQWAFSADILRLLSFGILPQLISYPSGWVYFSIGNPITAMWWGVFGWGIMILGTVIGAQFGVEGIALATSTTLAALTVPCMLVAFRGTPLSFGTLCRSLKGPICAGAISGLIVALALMQMPVSSNALLRLVVGVGTFLLLYAGLLVTAFGQRQLILDTLSRIRSLRATATT